METRTKEALDARNHDRSAMIQWVALGLVALLGVIATVMLTDGGGGGGHGGHLGAAVVSQFL